MILISESKNIGTIYQDIIKEFDIQLQLCVSKKYMQVQRKKLPLSDGLPMGGSLSPLLGHYMSPIKETSSGIAPTF